MRLSRPLLLLVLAIAVLAPTAGAAQRRAEPVAPTAPEREIVQRINAARAAKGLPAVQLVDGLVRSARAHSKAMLDADVFSHDSPNGEAFDRRIRRFHVARQLGETIAWGSGSYGTPAGIVGMWLKSPPHRAILLDRAFTRVGVGRAFGTFQGMDEAAIWTADFASSR